MLFPPRLTEPIRQFFADARTVLISFFQRITEITAELRNRAEPVLHKLIKELPPEKRRLVFVVSIGIFAIFVLIFSGSLLLNKGSRAGRSVMADHASARQGIIPVDDLFLPEEPDFVPGVLAGREQRTMWTAGDAEPLWQDPLKEGEEPWRNQIEKTIDEIMENIP